MVSQTLEVARACSEAVVSSVVVFSYTYIVLKLGLEFKASLLSAFLCALFRNVAVTIAAVVGIVLTNLEDCERFRWLPSAAAFGCPKCGVSIAVFLFCVLLWRDEEDRRGESRRGKDPVPPRAL
jgi:hypothetical protein